MYIWHYGSVHYFCRSHKRDSVEILFSVIVMGCTIFSNLICILSVTVTSKSPRLRTREIMSPNIDYRYTITSKSHQTIRFKKTVLLFLLFCFCLLDVFCNCKQKYQKKKMKIRYNKLK